MSIEKLFQTHEQAIAVHARRTELLVSNLANADTVSTTENEIYRSRQPVFAAVMQALGNEQSSIPVRTAGIVESREPARQEYQPDHPLANSEGYIYRSNVNSIEEMTNMMSASRSYQNSVEVFNTSKQLLLKTLSIGR